MDADFVKRLVFVRYLARSGEAQTRLPEPMGAAGLLTLHDAVELFLVLAAEKLQADHGKKTTFDEYWGAINAKLAAPLPYKTALARMNDARVNLKHRGFPPPTSALESYRTTVREFLVDSTKQVFQIEFDALTFADLVANTTVREHLTRSAAAESSGERRRALGWLRVAFDQLVADYLETKRSIHGGSQFFVETLTFPPREPEGVAELGEVVSRALNQINERLVVMALGVDMRQYVRFRMLTPHARAQGEELISYGTADAEDDDAVDFCTTFVIEAAIALQEADYELRPPRALLEERERQRAYITEQIRARNAQAAKAETPAAASESEENLEKSSDPSRF